VDEVVVAGGLCVRKREAGEGAGAKSDETERDGSVSGTPRETAVEGDGGRWWDEVDTVVVVVGLRVRKREAGGAGGAKSDEIECDGSISGAPCEMTVEGDGGGGGTRSMTWWWSWGSAFAKARQEGGLGPNPMKPSAMARFRARRVKWRWRVMGGGGGTRWIRCWWSWGCAFANARQEGLGGPKSQNRAILARFWAAFEQQVVEWGAVGL